MDWVIAPQRAAVVGTDAVACGWADGLLTRFEIRGGPIRGWHQHRQSAAEAAPLLAETPAAWREFADHNARLVAAQNTQVHSSPTPCASRGDMTPFAGTEPVKSQD